MLLCPNISCFFKTDIDTSGGNLNLKIKSRAQQITLKPNIINVNILIHLQNLQNKGLILQKRLQSLKKTNE